MIQVGIGTRSINCIVDTLLIFLLSYIAYRGWSFYVFYYNIQYIPFYIFFDVVLVIYYVFFEGIFKRTPGKWLSVSKVVSNKGNKPNFLQIFIRSLVRITIIDLFFYPFLEKTLHDYISKTNVVEA